MPIIEGSSISKKLSSKYRKIGFAEFIEKNKQMLGFENPARSLIMCIKEAVDNSLDACEEANILPEIYISIQSLKKLTGKNYFSIVIKDNGPGVPRDKVPNVFGSLLYGSKFHSLKQNRGQQGIGISAAVLYGQITTGSPAKIISKVEEEETAFEALVSVNRDNTPSLKNKKRIVVDYKSGTEVHLKVLGSYVKKGPKSLKYFINLISLINPHATLIFEDPLGEKYVYNRIVNKPITIACETLPHPKSLEIGIFKRMLALTPLQTLSDFLKYEILGIDNDFLNILKSRLKVPLYFNPKDITLYESENILNSLVSLNIKPSIDSLSLINPQNLQLALRNMGEFSIISSTVSSIGLLNGNSFVVEGGIVFGGDLPKDTRIEIIRVANKMPLTYKEGSCLITKEIFNFKWRNYNVAHRIGECPIGPFKLFIHLAASKIPYTSQSKEAVADIPELKSKMDEVLKILAKKISKYIRNKELEEKNKEKIKVIENYLPYFAKIVSSVVDKPVPELNIVKSKIMDCILIIELKIENDESIVKSEEFVLIKNYRLINITRRKYTLLFIDFLKNEDGTIIKNIQTINVEPMSDEKISLTFKNKNLKILEKDSKFFYIL